MKSSGTRYVAVGMELEAGGYLEQSENRGAVVRGSDGMLRYAYFESSSAGVRASAKIESISSLGILVEGRIGSAVDRSSDRTIPLHPLINLRGNIGYELNKSIDIFSNIIFQSARPVSRLDSAAATSEPDLPAYLLVDIGASYAFLPKLSINAAVTNLLATGWEIFPGYGAQGLEVRVGARLEF